MGKYWFYYEAIYWREDWIMRWIAILEGIIILSFLSERCLSVLNISRNYFPLFCILFNRITIIEIANVYNCHKLFTCLNISITSYGASSFFSSSVLLSSSVLTPSIPSFLSFFYSFFHSFDSFLHSILFSFLRFIPSFHSSFHSFVSILLLRES